MDVLIAVPHFPPTHLGGAEYHALGMARGLVDRGHGVRVLCVEGLSEGAVDRARGRDDVFDGIPVRRLHLERSPGRPLRHEYDDPVIADCVRAEIARARPDVLHLVSGYLLSASPLLVAAAEGIATMVTLTDFWFLCPRIDMVRSDGTLSAPPLDFARCARCRAEERRRWRWPARLAPGLAARYWRHRPGAGRPWEERHAFLRQALAGAGAVGSPSSFLRSFYEAAGVPGPGIEVRRQGLGPPAQVLPPLAGVPGRDRPLVVGFLGRLYPPKGVHVLVEAMRHLDGAPVVARIHGSPNDPRYADRLARSARGDDRVELAGAYPRERVPEILGTLDVVVVPSLWWENSPNVILEAFAYGLPVVTSDLGGMAEMVEHERNGLLFPAGDAAALGACLRRLIEEPGLLDRLRAAAPEVKSRGTYAEQIEGVYRRLLAGSPG